MIINVNKKLFSHQLRGRSNAILHLGEGVLGGGGGQSLKRDKITNYVNIQPEFHLRIIN